jgi:hypothetical protein
VRWTVRILARFWLDLRDRAFSGRGFNLSKAISTPLAAALSEDRHPAHHCRLRPVRRRPEDSVSLPLAGENEKRTLAYGRLSSKLLSRNLLEVLASTPKRKIGRRHRRISLALGGYHALELDFPDVADPVGGQNLAMALGHQDHLVEYRGVRWPSSGASRRVLEQAGEGGPATIRSESVQSR